MAIERKKRVARLVQRVLGDAFLRHVHVAELRGLIVTRVEMPPDLKRAVVYFELLGGREADATILEALEGERGELQRRLSKEASLRNTPILEFRPDLDLANADRLVALIDSVAPPEEAPSHPKQEDDPHGPS